MKIDWLVSGIIMFSSVGIATAQDRMLNISASGDVEWNEPQIACTIVTGYREFAVLAEAVTPQTDPYLFVTRIDQEAEGLDNNDWVDFSNEEKEILEEFLRLPNTNLDSALLIWISNLPVCAYAYEFREQGSSGKISNSRSEPDFGDFFAGPSDTQPSPTPRRTIEGCRSRRLRSGTAGSGVEHRGALALARGLTWL